jgi:hypothetical protein
MRRLATGRRRQPPLDGWDRGRIGCGLDRVAQKVHAPAGKRLRSSAGWRPKREAQRDVIDRYFFDEVDVPEIAARRAVAPSTVYNQKASAQTTLHDDDVFFSALYSLRRVRDRARAEHLARAYPDGFLPDGRRIVIIDHAA